MQEGGKALVSHTHKNIEIPFTPSYLPLLNESLTNSVSLTFPSFIKSYLENSWRLNVKLVKLHTRHRVSSCFSMFYSHTLSHNKMY